MAARKSDPGVATAAPAAKKKSILREYSEAIVIAVTLALIIRAFLVQAFSIPSGSMEPTLLIGDYLLVNKFIYGIRNPFTNKVLIPVENPERGDIVVFIYPPDPDKDYIKRVVGIAGDKIHIIDKKLYINDQLVQTPQAVNTDQSLFNNPGDPPRDNFGPAVVPPDCLFVLGDNRDHSYDSRFWGFVPLSELRGKAFIIYWSWNKKNLGVRWDRLGKLIH